MPCNLLWADHTLEFVTGHYKWPVTNSICECEILCLTKAVRTPGLVRNDNFKKFQPATFSTINPLLICYMYFSHLLTENTSN